MEREYFLKSLLAGALVNTWDCDAAGNYGASWRFWAAGRLLHEKDGLARWDAPAPVEIEALSNAALLVLAL
jgi:protocatechuate 3,4-dioxygenase beta subunit